MADIDTYKVDVYVVAKGIPKNPSVDEKVDSTLVDSNGNWNLSVDNNEFNSEGRWEYYTVGEDLAGNRSLVGASIYRDYLPPNLKCSSGTEWTIGELTSIQIGAFNG